MTGVQFWAAGIPQPQGSKSVHMLGGKPVMRDANSHRLHAWRREVAGAAGVAWLGEPLREPVRVSLRFVFPRPAGAPRSRRWPSVRPDLDKLVRAVLDALTGVVLADDALVVSLQAHKVYLGTGPGVAIAVRAMDDVDRLAHMEDA